MTRRQLAVPMVAALLGGAVTAAGMIAGSNSNGAVGRQQGLLALETGERFSAAEIYDRAAPSVVSISARSVQPGGTAFQADAGSELGLSTGSGFVLDERRPHRHQRARGERRDRRPGDVPRRADRPRAGGRQGRGDRPRGAARRDRRRSTCARSSSATRATCGRATAWWPSATRPALQATAGTGRISAAGRAGRGAGRLRDRRPAGDRRGDRAGHLRRPAAGRRRARGRDHHAARRRHRLRRPRQRRPRRARRSSRRATR